MGKGRIGHFATNVSVSLVAIAISLFICELSIRLFVNPVDILTPKLKEDNILGHRILPKSGGHDSWGFRNNRVPDSVDIVALGDSFTYGNSAKMSEAWPFVLHEISAKSVYNLGMGGYGPNQYYYLFLKNALKLKPKCIICGFYLGNDIRDAYVITYSKDYWSDLRNGKFDKLESSAASAFVPWHKKTRLWLSDNSVIYRLVIHGVFLGDLKRKSQALWASRHGYPVLRIKDKGILQTFDLADKLKNLSLDRPDTSEGLRITLNLLKKMSSECKKEGIHLLIALIPTKESVYAGYFQNNFINSRETIEQIIQEERTTTSAIIDFFNKNSIQYVDLLPILQEGIKSKMLYPAGLDPHFNKTGYRFIAEYLYSIINSMHLIQRFYLSVGMLR